MRRVFLVSLLVINMISCTAPAEKLMWADEFEGTSLNLENWNYKLGDGCPTLCGWGNNEPQVYTKENHEVSNGTLKIYARLKDSVYTSTRITTANKVEFKYGRVEARIKLPSGKGLWPAFWMLGSDIKTNAWPASGEIDIMEWVGRDKDSLFTSLHTPASYGNTINTKKTYLENISEWHTYSCDWDEESIIFYRDDVEVYRFNPEVKDEKVYPFRKPFYMIINMAVGGNFGGEIDDTIFPQQLEVDYVRVWQ